MALIACAECAQQISDTARRCPSCGATTTAATDARSRWTPIIGIPAVLVLAVILLWLLNMFVDAQS